MIYTILSQQQHRLAVVLLFCFYLFNTSPVASAGEVDVVHSLSFGMIDLHPSGDTIVIDAHNGVTHSPVAGRSVVTGGGSGLLRVTPSMDTDEHVTIIYPNTSILYNGRHNLYIVDIADNSQYSASGLDLIQGGPVVEVNIGGKVVLQGNEINSSYSGSMNISLNFF